MAFNAFSNKLNPENGAKKQKIIPAAVIVIILAGAAAVYFVFFRSSTPAENVSSFIEQNLPASGSEISIDEIIKEIDFDANFLESSRFQTLRTFKEWPLKIEQKGRKNPFSY
ncbi:hypothetical protein KKD72_00465 [Patescibacteria group bacterium]|nr:hypothetical protein [Patescibacteria group bacterium]